MLKRGSKGKYVETLQTYLVQFGILSGSVDGDFGRKTEEAVRNLQRGLGLPVTGTVDAELFNMLPTIVVAY